MSASGLSAIHIMLQGQTVDAEYYVEDILEWSKRGENGTFERKKAAEDLLKFQVKF